MENNTENSANNTTNESSGNNKKSPVVLLIIVVIIMAAFFILIPKMNNDTETSNSSKVTETEKEDSSKDSKEKTSTKKKKSTKENDDETDTETDDEEDDKDSTTKVESDNVEPLNFDIENADSYFITSTSYKSKCGFGPYTVDVDTSKIKGLSEYIKLQKDIKVIHHGLPPEVSKTAISKEDAEKIINELDEATFTTSYDDGKGGAFTDIEISYKDRKDNTEYSLYIFGSDGYFDSGDGNIYKFLDEHTNIVDNCNTYNMKINGKTTLKYINQ